jgi:hypothetical protein
MASKLTPIPLRDKAAIFAILAGLLGVLAYAVYTGAGAGAVNLSALYAHLPADAAAFRARVFSAFPLQAPEADFVQALSRQGFTADGWFSKRMTFRRQNGGSRGCDFTASVVWEADDQGRISALEPRFLRRPGCVDVR